MTYRSAPVDPELGSPVADTQFDPTPDAVEAGPKQRGKKPRASKPAKAGKAKKRGHRALWISLTAVFLALVLATAGGYVFWWMPANEAPEPTFMETLIRPERLPPPIPPPDPAWPLTGLPMATEDAGDYPSLCIKIENSRSARPQLGLDSADIVIEEVVEGGITRFMAIFHSTLPKEVEPVRSMRPMDPPLAKPFGCPLIFSGGQYAFVQDARKSLKKVISMDSGDKGFSRDRKRSAPHNVIGDIDTFMKTAKAAKLTSPPSPFEFPDLGHASSVVTSGEEASRLDLKMSNYSSVAWKWDPVKSVWLRYEGKDKAVVVSGKQIYATNVVTLTVKIAMTAKRPGANPVPETKIVGKGKGTLSAGGRNMPINWSKSKDSTHIVLTDLQGNPVTLIAGNTWIELVPTSGSVKVST